MDDSPPTLLTIAGTSPTLGAGVGADVQVFRDFGYEPLWVPTVLLDQDTRTVRSRQSVDPGWLTGTISTAVRVGQPKAIKIGLLPSPATVDAVLTGLGSVPRDTPIVLDPVLSTGSGVSLHEDGLVHCLRDTLLKRVALLTPNIPEAEALTGRSIKTLAEAESAAAALVERGARAVLLKGGHLPDAPGDVLATPDSTRVLSNDAQFGVDVHGTGCHLSSALAALLAQGHDIDTACRRARRYLVFCVSLARCLPGGGRPIIPHNDETQSVARNLRFEIR